ncbi:MAG: thio(seleno)oxazole modification radical SAM maturase SbtM [Nitrospirota bacterium]|nr:thio(seleno)oxazole modification radical SAM maturase SbtM [Nitrospirota bacterium]
MDKYPARDYNFQDPMTPNKHMGPTAYAATQRIIGPARWKQALNRCAGSADPDALLSAVRDSGSGADPDYLAELIRLERAYALLSERADSIPVNVDRLTANPTVAVPSLGWSGLAGFLEPNPESAAASPEETPERLLLWFDPRSGRPRARQATNEDLLVLKMVLEEIPSEAVAAEGGLPIGAVDGAIERAVRQGFVLAPQSLLRRDPSVFTSRRDGDAEFLSTPSFTLQWHITQVCDLHCKHCYDRSDRSPLALDNALRVLDDLRAFCRSRNVQGAVSFTGGNPLLHPNFLEIYRAAADRNFGLAILGNPAPRRRLEEILSIAMPSFFQVSLEGLREHNDGIRGAGHFDRIMDFLDLLKELKVSSMVMLTLTSGNRDQVLPLAEALRDRTDAFHFNRLALFGEGANLAMTERNGYRRFLEEYLTAAETNPVMGTKDNLINVLLRERGMDLFGGCTGYGCGAAFNFVTLLADGEVHACRKLPSPIGNIRERTLGEIYDSDAAQRYRLGPSSCSGCDVRIACGGCLAVAKSSGLDIFSEKDPFCFKD